MLSHVKIKCINTINAIGAIGKEDDAAQFDAWVCPSEGIPALAQKNYPIYQTHQSCWNSLPR